MGYAALCFSWRAGGALPVPGQPARGQRQLVGVGREALCQVCDLLAWLRLARRWRSEHIAGHVARVRPYLCEAGSAVIDQKHASFKQCMVVVIPEDLFPHCGDIAVIGVQGGEEGGAELDAAIFECSR